MNCAYFIRILLQVIFFSFILSDGRHCWPWLYRSHKGINGGPKTNIPRTLSNSILRFSAELVASTNVCWLNLDPSSMAFNLLWTSLNCNKKNHWESSWSSRREIHLITATQPYKRRLGECYPLDCSIVLPGRYNSFSQLHQKLSEL